MGCHDVQPQHLAKAHLADDLDKATAFAVGQGLAIGDQREAAYLYLMACLVRLLFRQAHARNLGIGVDARRYCLEVESGTVAQCIFDSYFPSVTSNVRQLQPSSHVTDGIDAGNVGLHPLIDGDTSLFDMHACSLQAQILNVGSPPDGDQHLVCLECEFAFFGSNRGLEATVQGIQARHAAGQMQFHAPSAQAPLQGLAQFGVHEGNEAVEHLDNGYLDSEGAKDVGKFHSDHAAADDEHSLGQLLQRQGCGGVDDAWQIHARKRQLNRPRPCGDDDVLGLEPLESVWRRHLESAGTDEATAAIDHLHLCLAQEHADAADETLDHSLLALENGRPVGFDRPDQPQTIVLGVLHGAEDLGASQQGLGWDAAHIETDAAKAALLDDGDLCAELCSA